MARTVSIGTQDFEKMIQRNCFYVDKTGFIKEWWESEDEVTLITRPRRFGKTLNMSMLNCFFSNKYADRGELFEKLEIWKDGKYREIQGTYPVIFLSFASIKSNNFTDTKNDIVAVINGAFRSHSYLLDSDVLSDAEKEIFESFDRYANNISVDKEIANETVYRALNNLSLFLSRYYGKKVIILLDEYDTPMQEAYVNGYWEELVAFTRSLFNSTFKTNPYLERAIMTGITTAEYSAVRKFAKQTSNGSAKAETMSKESIFSDLNNLEVVTTLTPKYETAFGFTEEEVFKALDEQGLSDKKKDVKIWYDGLRFGSKNDIYNPWSIINCLDKKKIALYWAESSSNGLINSLVQKGSSNIKMMVEELINGSTINVPIDEQSSLFFHGFVLGLMVDQSENYIITSNRESGFGRYDIMLEPKDKQTQKYPGIVIEFKVINPRKENSLEETVEAALKQIEEKNYDAELINRGVNKENIHHYGFAFKSKEVLIDGR